MRSDVLLRKAKSGCTSRLVHVGANLPIKSSSTICVLVDATQGLVRAHGSPLDGTL